MSNDNNLPPAGLDNLAPEYVRTHLREIALTPEESPWLAQLAEEQAYKDILAEHKAVMDYKLMTPPAGRSFSGWQDYKIHRGLPFLPTDMEEQRFWEIMEDATLNASAPAASAPQREKAAPPTEGQRRAQIELCRERIMKKHGAAVEAARAAGWLVGWRWQGAGNGAGPLYLWLMDSGISKLNPKTNEVSWNLVDGVFENRAGQPVTRGSLSASKSAKEGA